MIVYKSTMGFIAGQLPDTFTTTAFVAAIFNPVITTTAIGNNSLQHSKLALP